MKKIILAITAVVGVSLSGFSQGQVTVGNNNANGYVVIDPSGDLSTSTASYTVASSFNVEIWSLAVSSTAGLTGLDAYGSLNPLDLTSDGFQEDSLAAGGSNIAGTAGVFGGNNGVTAIINGVTSANAAIAVVAWTGSATTLAAAIADGADIGTLVFENAVGPAPQSPFTANIIQGWGTLANSPASAANGDNQDLIMSPVVVPEPGTMALAGLGSLSLFLLRRKK